MSPKQVENVIVLEGDRRTRNRFLVELSNARATGDAVLSDEEDHSTDLELVISALYSWNTNNSQSAQTSD